MSRRTDEPTEQDDLRAFVGVRSFERGMRRSGPRHEQVADGAADRPVVLHRGGAAWGINMPRLYAIEDAIERGAALEPLRDELAAVVAALAYTMERKPGRTTSKPLAAKRKRDLFVRAATVFALVKSHGVELEEAKRAVCGHGEEHERERESVRKKYEEILNKGGTVYVLGSHVRAALNRIAQHNAASPRGGNR